MESAGTANDDIRPYADFNDVKDLVSQLYGFKVKSCKRLNGYDDQNFHVLVEDEHCNPNIQSPAKSGYVLKILNSNDTRESKGHLRAQLGMMKLANECGIVCPQHVPNKTGAFFSDHLIPDSTRNGTKMHTVRLLEYIEGEIISSVTITPQLLTDGGAYLSDFHSAVNDFEDDNLRRDDYLWNPVNIHMLKPYIPALHDEEHRAFAHAFVDRWPAVASKLRALPYRPIHCDFNEQNLLVKPQESGGYRIAAILDFQDSSYGYRVVDVAVYMMYMMTTCSSHIHPIDVGKFCLESYLKKTPLSDSELSVLYDCVIARFMQSLVLGVHFYSLLKDPYLLVTQKPGWHAVKQLCTKPGDATLQYWLS